MKPNIILVIIVTFCLFLKGFAQIPGTQNFWFVAEEVSTSIPTGMTITNADQNKYVVSIYDDDYEPAPSPLPPATLLSLVADGSTETLIDIQGVIGTLGSDDELTVALNYSATAAVDYPAFSETVSVPSTLIEGGSGPIDLTLSYDAGTTVAGDGTITATIAAATTLNVKKLDLYGAGFYDPIIGYPLAAFSLSTDDSGGAGTVGVRIISEIPDREFGDGAHGFLYIPVVAEDGNTWLNHNLGADYTNVNHASFNPTQKATAHDDHLAYGSMYQWGRYSDGHELLIRNSATSATPVNGSTAIKSPTPFPNHSDWIKSDTGWHDAPAVNDLWLKETSINNTCPDGYRVPLHPEWNNYLTFASITEMNSAAASDLGLPVTGLRNRTNGSVCCAGSIYTYYWAGNAPSDASAYNINITTTKAVVSSATKDYGMSVRCIKDY